MLSIGFGNIQSNLPQKNSSRTSTQVICRQLRGQNGGNGDGSEQARIIGLRAFGGERYYNTNVARIAQRGTAAIERRPMSRNRCHGRGCSKSRDAAEQRG